MTDKGGAELLAPTAQSALDPTASAAGPGGAHVGAAGRLRGSAWILRRLGWGVLTLFAVTILIFIATQALPGNAARIILGHTATPARLRVVERQLGLDKSLVSQYLTWLGHLLSGNLGRSFISSDPVSSVVIPRLANSAILVGLSAAISIPLSVIAGAYAGSRRDKLVDHTISVIGLALTSVPEFVIGIVLVVIFATSVFHILPSVVLLSPGQGPLQAPKQLILPVGTLVLAVFPYLSRLVRASVIDVYESEYVRMARLKGAPDRRILWRHVLPNALVPAIQATSLTLAWLSGGIVVIESLFNYPGLGTALEDAVQQRDLPTIQAIVLIFGAAYVTFNLIGDLLTVYLTPRLRTANA